MSTPPRGAARDAAKAAAARLCFNPRPRAGGGVAGVAQVLVTQVSIHAPARGAAISGFHARDQGAVSIHAPARGAAG